MRSETRKTMSDTRPLDVAVVENDERRRMASEFMSFIKKDGEEPKTTENGGGTKQ
uniref:Uncharacterized protein n=1 Tax=Cucumis melo TaxID=3656 RepID=A0A9I9CW97_CUCME